MQRLLYPDIPCFGCGLGNDRGLRLESFAGDDGEVTAAFRPWPEHDNGLGYLNGGIIGTVLDCHSAAAVMWQAHLRGWPPLPGAALSYVTAGLDVRYLRPTPLHEELTLLGRVTEPGEDVMVAEVEVFWDGKPRATATATWKRWRPRPA